MGEIISELLKIFIPAAVVLYGMYLTVQTFLAKQFETKQLEIKHKNTELLTPICLQAYERMILFLERINPTNLLVRVSAGNLSAIDYQRVLLQEIREEYNHNLSQQLYMSHEAWEKIQQAMNEVITLINTSSSGVKPDETGLNLSKKIFEKVITEGKQPVLEATKFFKRRSERIISLKIT